MFITSNSFCEYFEIAEIIFLAHTMNQMWSANATQYLIMSSGYIIREFVAPVIVLCVITLYDFQKIILTSIENEI